VTNVENVNVRAATANTFDASAITGATTIALDGSTAAGTVNGVAALTTGLKVANTAQNASFTIADAALTNTSDTVNLAMNGVTGGTIAIEGVTANASNLEKIAITSSTAASKGVTLNAGGTANYITTLTVAGDKSVGLTLTDTSYTTIDASANTASVDIDARAVTGVNTTITGTAGDDRIVVLNAGTDANDTVTGGTGTDTLGVVVANGATYTHSTNTKVTGFEVLELIDDGTGAGQTVTANVGGSFTSLKTSGGNAGNDNFAFTGVANGTTMTLSVDAATVSSTLKSDTGADTLTVVLDGLTTTGAVTAGNVETVTVTSQADTSSNANTLNSLTVSAATALTINGAHTANLGTVTTAANSTVTASAFTGATLTANLSGAVVKSYVGSAGKDVITVASDSVNSTNTFAGGAGTSDSLTDGGVTGNQGILNVTGFETVTMTLAGDSAIDVRNVTDMTKLVINSTADSITVDRLALATTAVTLDMAVGANAAETIAAATFTASTGSTLDLTINTDKAADTITTLTLDSGITALTLTSDGETAGTDGIVVTNAISSLGLTSITTKGDGLVTLSGTQAAQLVTFDGSASTGVQSVTLGATTGTTTITGGSKNDTLAGGAAADTFNGNGGADTLTGSTGANKYLIDSAAEARGATYAGTITTHAGDIEVITTFVATGSADVIQLSTGVDAYGSGMSLTTSTSFNVTNIGAIATADYATLNAALAAVQANTAGTASTSALVQVYSFTIVADGTTPGDFDSNSAGTYFLINDATAAINSNDTIIKVGTVTGTLAASDFVVA
jgi:S-layer protein